jgi:hypothetical protein
LSERMIRQSCSPFLRFMAGQLQREAFLSLSLACSMELANVTAHNFSANSSKQHKTSSTCDCSMCSPYTLRFWSCSRKRATHCDPECKARSVWRPSRNINPTPAPNLTRKDTIPRNTKNAKVYCAIKHYSKLRVAGC